LDEASSKKKIIYARVSSRNQKEDLTKQIEFLRVRFPQHELIEDIGSGLNFKRKGFCSLIERILEKEVSEVVVAHKDRLSRFGFELINLIAKKQDCEIVVLEDVKLSPQAELMQDLLSIIHVFSCRLYGLRKYKVQLHADSELSP
jgi:predicted site-specific integrase-resolvase